MWSSPVFAKSPDVGQQLVPPRFLERFTSKKVKKGSSITFSVKVEGNALLAPCPHPGRSEQTPPCLHGGPPPRKAQSRPLPALTQDPHPGRPEQAPPASTQSPPGRSEVPPSSGNPFPMGSCLSPRLSCPHGALAAGRGRAGRAVDRQGLTRLHGGQLGPAAQSGPAGRGQTAPGHLHLHCHQCRGPGPLLRQPAHLWL